MAGFFNLFYRFFRDSLARDLAREGIATTRRNDLLKKDEKRALKKASSTPNQTMQMFSSDAPELFFQFCDENPDINLIRNEKGKAYTESGFGVNFNKLMKKALAQGVLAEAFTLHDTRGKTANDSKSKEDAQRILDHKSLQTTQKHYRDKPEIIFPLAIKKQP